MFWLVVGFCICFIFTIIVPSTVTLTSESKPIPVGADLTLTCTVDLDPAVPDAPVTVKTMWTGPDGFMNTSTAHPVNGSTTTYISTAMVSSFGRNQSGVYNCIATVGVNKTMSSVTATFTVGKLDRYLLCILIVHITCRCISILEGNST